MSFKDDIAKLLAWARWIDLHAPDISERLRTTRWMNRNDFGRKERAVQPVIDRLHAGMRGREFFPGDYVLPCDVQLPGVRFKKGVTLSTLMLGISQREGPQIKWPDADKQFVKKMLADRPVGVVHPPQTHRTET